MSSTQPLDLKGGIREVKRAAEYCKEKVQNDGIIKFRKLKNSDLLSLATKEVLFLTDLPSAIYFDRTLNRIIRSRVEYLLNMYYYLLNSSEGRSLDSFITSSLSKILVLLQRAEESCPCHTNDEDSIFEDESLFSSIAGTKVIELEQSLSVDGDYTPLSNKDMEEEAELSLDRTQWCEMNLTALVVLTVTALKKSPKHRGSIRLNLSDCLTMCNSAIWQIQYLGIGLILTLLISENQQNSELYQEAKNNSINRKNIKPGKTEKKEMVQNKKKDRNKTNKSNKNSIERLKQPESKLENPNNYPNNNKKKAATIHMDKNLNTSDIKSKKLLRSQSGSFSRRPWLQFDNIEEICRSGSLRVIVWLLTHSKEIIRKTAAEILLLVLQRVSLSDNLKFNIEDSIDLDSFHYTNTSKDLFCTSCVEQGLVFQLEAISQGTSIQKTENETEHENYHQRAANDESVSVNQQEALVFPENGIRKVTQLMLNVVVEQLEKEDEGSDLQLKLLNSMMQSGNGKLRINIFSGLIFLSGRCSSLGRRLWSHSPSSFSLGTKKNPENTGKGLFFYETLLLLLRDHVELKLFVRLLIHFFQETYSIIQSYEEPEKSLFEPSEISISHEIATQTGIKDTEVDDEWLLHERCQILSEKVDPTIVISGRGRLTKMVCPTETIISLHSPILAESIKEKHIKQLKTVYKKLLCEKKILLLPMVYQSDLFSSPENNELNPTTESSLLKERLESIDDESIIKLKMGINELDDSHFIILEGNYEVWQEIFSHMVDSYLLKSSLESMTVIGIIEAFSLCSRYNINRLREKYHQELKNRINSTNLSQIFQCSLGGFYSTLYPKTSKNGVIVGLNPETTDPHSVHLGLLISCLNYLENNMEKIITPNKQNESNNILKCLHSSIGALLV